jgi:hypothetical protein
MLAIRRNTTARPRICLIGHGIGFLVDVASTGVVSDAVVPRYMRLDLLGMVIWTTPLWR